MWVNVGKGLTNHITALETAYCGGADVVCIQEPWTWPGSRTQSHPGYEYYTPIDSWSNGMNPGDPVHLSERPRVLTYVRKGAKLQSQQRSMGGADGGGGDRDILWVDVNGFTILNIYREPGTNKLVDYVTRLRAPPNCLIGGDFNARHSTFEPGVTTYGRGGELAAWSTDSGMDYLGTPGEPTHREGHVLDLTFSNVPFASTSVRKDLHCGSDHESLMTILPGRGMEAQPPLKHRIADDQLETFASLVHIGIGRLPDPWSIGDPQSLDEYAASLEAMFKSAIETAGKRVFQGGRNAPWWTPELRELHRAHLRCRGTGVSEAERAFKKAVRAAKRDYWRRLIDGIETDNDLYKIIGWHKLTPRTKAPPLVVGGATIEETPAKAETLRREILERFSPADDLESDPLEGIEEWEQRLEWNSTLTLEEVERNTVGVSSTSPGTDLVTVRLLKACWDSVRSPLHGFYSRCLELGHYPSSWKLAEVVMLPKVGKKDKTSPRSWRPIALLSCVAKGLERTIARRMAWTALKSGLLSPQHCGAIPKRSVVDLVASLTHDIETGFAAGKESTLVTLDVQGAYDALLHKRLLRRMRSQGWHQNCLKIVSSFLTGRTARIRLEDFTSAVFNLACGTPQGSPLSPVLYMLYLQPLLSTDPNLRFGYADDLALLRQSDTLNTNAELLSQDIHGILLWGEENKISFAPEKVEAMHFSVKRGGGAPPIPVNAGRMEVIKPITTAEHGEQPAIRWLGVWLDRKLTFNRHVSERVTKGMKIARHIRGLGRVTCGPPATALRKAVTTCVLPALLFGAEVWYAGRSKPAANGRQVSTRSGPKIDAIGRAIVHAARGVLPAWKTAPTAAILRDTGLPAGLIALEEVKLRFARRLQTLDTKSPLVARTTYRTRVPKTRLQRVGALLPAIHRPRLAGPRYTPGCLEDPTSGKDKETAAAEFKAWWAALPPGDITVFSDGSKQRRLVEGQTHSMVGYGYAIYQNGLQIATGRGAVHRESQVFDAEAIGAWRGLEHTTRLHQAFGEKVWMCIDNTSVIQGLRGEAPTSSQWAFRECHAQMGIRDIGVRWSPGHCGIEGNEAADRLADQGASSEPEGMAAIPTASGIKSLARSILAEARAEWWSNTKLSGWYRQWELPYNTKAPPELSLPRRILQYHTALRTSHGDFSWYHTKFKHEDARLECSCGHAKTPDHLARCTRTRRFFARWPERPSAPPDSRRAGISYLKRLLEKPKALAEYLALTGFFTRICPR